MLTPLFSRKYQPEVEFVLPHVLAKVTEFDSPPRDASQDLAILHPQTALQKRKWGSEGNYYRLIVQNLG